ncbi:MAG: ABC transporter substrate-binding protein [Pseudomonadota bacterium]
MNKMILSIFFVLLSLSGPICIAFAENGVTQNQILLGQSCALSGPALEIGRDMRAGLNAYFEKVNETGGIHGRKIKLISLDDGYEPEKAITNTRELIEKYKVFTLIGEVGTPTSMATLPMAQKAGIPFFGPFTGAEFLRTPFKKYVINVRGSYYQEMEKLAQYLVDQKGKKKIACFYQNDGYGEAGLNGIKIALKKRGLELAGTGLYERNTVRIKSGLIKIRKANPEVVVMVGAYEPCAQFIKLAKQIGMTDVVFCNISFVGTEALRKELGNAGEGCIISQVVVYPWDKSIPLVKEYTDAMKKYQPSEKIGFVSLEGYIVGKLFCSAAEKTENLSREGLIETIESTGIYDFGGVKLNFGQNDHQGMDEIFLTIIRNGQILPYNY